MLVMLSLRCVCIYMMCPPLLLPLLPPALQAWLGHPYLDVIDNTTDFEQKVRRVIEMVCRRMGKRLGVDIDDRLQAQSRKRKFLIKSLPDVEVCMLCCQLHHT